MLAARPCKAPDARGCSWSLLGAKPYRGHTCERTSEMRTYGKMRVHSTGLSSAWALALLSFATIATTAHYLTAQVPSAGPDYRAFLKANCLRCHDADNSTAGVRVDNLDEKFGDDTVKKWEAVHHRIAAGTMPPKGTPQPSPQERQAMADWIAKNI